MLAACFHEDGFEEERCRWWQLEAVDPLLKFFSALHSSRWDDLENNPELQEWANYGLGAAYGLIAAVALVSSAC